MNLLDFGIIGIIVLLTLLGFYQGFLVSVLNIASFFVSWLVSVIVSPAAATLVKAQQSLATQMLYYTEGAELIGNVEYARTMVSQLSAQQMDKIVSESTVPSHIDSLVRSNMAGEVFKTQNISTVGDYFNQTIVNFAINVISFLAVFLIVRAILSIFIHATDYTVKLPVLKHFDGLLGGAFGIVRGLFIVFLIFMVVPVLLVVLGGFGIKEYINNSFLGSIFYDANFLLALVTGV